MTDQDAEANGSTTFDIFAFSSDTSKRAYFLKSTTPGPLRVQLLETAENPPASVTFHPENICSDRPATLIFDTSCFLSFGSLHTDPRAGITWTSHGRVCHPGLITMSLDTRLFPPGPRAIRIFRDSPRPEKKERCLLVNFPSGTRRGTGPTARPILSGSG